MKNNFFKGLYTFDQVAKIYNIDNSTLRKMVQANKFTKNDVKKFGKTWIITEQGIAKKFDINILRDFEREQKLKELKALRELKANNKKNKRTYKPKKVNDSLNCDVDDAYNELTEIIVNPKDIKQSFKF